MKFNPTDTRRFLRHVMPPGTVLEMRVFRAQFGRSNYIEPAPRYSSTFSGYYDNPDALIVDAGRLNGISGFITPNPVRRDFLARSANKLVKAKNTTTDDDIACSRWVYVDIDPVRPADLSATDEELGLAVDTRDRIFLDFPEIKESAIWGKSGNGAWILVRLNDRKNTPENREIVADALKILSDQFTTDRVKIDTTTKNPARVMCIPGTAKCKGSSIPERPWRLATIDSE